MQNIHVDEQEISQQKHIHNFLIQMNLINTVYIHIANTIKYIAVSFPSINHFRNYLSMKTDSSKK